MWQTHVPDRLRNTNGNSDRQYRSSVSEGKKIIDEHDLSGENYNATSRENHHPHLNDAVLDSNRCSLPYSGTEAEAGFLVSTNSGSNASVEPSHQKVFNSNHFNTSASLARSRKRARNENRSKMIKSDGDPNNSDDNDYESSSESRNVLIRPDISNLDTPSGELRPATDLDTPYRGRQLHHRYQAPPVRRDSSLSGYGQSSLYGSTGGTLPRRRRLDSSLTRATTITGVDPRGALRPAQRLAESIRSGIIPPPPSEPPPATPLSGSLLSDMGITGQGSLINPFSLQLQEREQQQRLALATMGNGQSQLFSTLNANLSNTNDQLLQWQQQIQLQQQQQQQANFLETQLRQQQLLAASALHPMPSPVQPSHYLHALGTLNRQAQADPGNPYISTAAFLSAQQQQQQQYQLHQRQFPANHITGAGTPSLVIPTANPLGSLLAQTNSTDLTGCGQGGSGSVVYENSYNSFQRPLPNVVPPSISHDVLTSLSSNAVVPGLLMNTGGGSSSITLPPNGAAIGNSATLGRTGNTPPPAFSQVQSVMSVSGHPPPPPPNHPNFDPVYNTAATVAELESYPRPGSKYPSDRGPRKMKCCPWYAWLIVILVVAFLLALVLAVSFSAEKKYLEQRFQKLSVQNPSIIGLFNPKKTPVELTADLPIQIVLDSMGVWTATWMVRTARYVRYNITVSSPLSSVGLYMRLNTMPTIVRYDIFDRISGQILAPNTPSPEPIRVKRSTNATSLLRPVRQIYQPVDSSRETARLHYLEEGTWFIAIVNDQPRKESLTFSMGDAVIDHGCPNDCSNRGVCNRGNCECVNGFRGPDCSIAQLPKVCNGHGDYAGGACHCYPEWKGLECEVLWSECPDPLCSGHGQCVTGECQCYPGFSGESCETRHCPAPNCTNNGICTDGKCRCFSGWSGEACDLAVPVMNAANLMGNSQSPSATVRRTIHSVSSTSAVSLQDPSSDAACQLNCGSNGNCEWITASDTDELSQPYCRCLEGWTGTRCSDRLCDQRCLTHGQCSNGTCVCSEGFNGRHCTLNGCPDRCGIDVDHGKCLINPVNNRYACQCEPGWNGSACQTHIEEACDDGIDNDKDELIDCMDPNCCTSSHCQQLMNHHGAEASNAKQSCAQSESFNFRLLVTKVTSPGSTFYGKLEFLLGRDHMFANNFDPRRTSIIRGTVRQSDGTVFWGCRVSDRRKLHLGYTFPDDQGRFDLPVEGGTVVQLEFLRYPVDRFSALYHIYVPVNEIVNIGDFYVAERSSQPVPTDWIIESPYITGGSLSPSPIMHDLWVTRNSRFWYDATESNGLLCGAARNGPLHDPVVLGGPFVWTIGPDSFHITNCIESHKSICVDNGVLTYSIPIQGTRIRLIYRSNRASGYQARLVLQLLASGRPPPETLKELHLILDVVGQRQVERLEPDSGLTHTFYWNKTDGYNRPVYGLVNAKVSVGYIYSGCAQIFWEYRSVTLQGYELTSSELRNWNLNIVHLYSVNHGIVYRGDGSHIFLKYADWHISAVLGSAGTRRPANHCNGCSGGTAHDSPVLHIHGLFTDSVGNLTVGDGIYLRLLHSPEVDIPRRFDQSSEPFDSRAQLTHQLNDRRIWDIVGETKLNFLPSTRDETLLSAYYLAPHPNFVSLKSELDLSGPSGLDSGLFVSYPDSRTIWWLPDSNASNARPIVSADCSLYQSSPQQLHAGIDCTNYPLIAPGALTVTPAELYFIDGNFIRSMRLHRLADAKHFDIQVVVGSQDQPVATGSRSRLCDGSVQGTDFVLHQPMHIVYNSLEDAIFFTDQKQVYRLHLTSRAVSLVAGRLAGCDAEEKSNSPYPLATNVELSAIHGLTVSPEGALYIAEPRKIWIRQADNRLYHVAGKVNDPASISNAPIRSSTGSLLTDLGLAQEFEFANISSLICSLYGELFVADSVNGQIYRIHYWLPHQRNGSQTYRVFSPNTDEVYSFNRHGQLIHTENAVTQNRLHQMTYGFSVIHGGLSQIQDNNVNLRLNIRRDTQGNFLTLQTPSGLSYNITFAANSPQYMTELTDPVNGGSWYFRYSEAGFLTQLRRPQSASGGLIHFDYDPQSGHLRSIRFPDGSGWDTSTLSTNPSVLQQATGYAFDRTIAAQTLLTVYNPDSDRWSVDLGQMLHLPDSDLLNRPGRLFRHIKLPERSGLPSLSSTSLWTFSVNLKRHNARYRRHGSVIQVASASWPSQRPLLDYYALSVTRNKRHPLYPPFLPAGTSDTVGDWLYRKTLTVNGHEILHVNFDWTRQLETYQSALTGDTLLQIVYNENFQPMIFNASGVASNEHGYNLFRSMDRQPSISYSSTSSKRILNPFPLSLTYTNNGNLNMVNWGTVMFHFTYDSSGRLTSADLGGSKETTSYRYANTQLPHRPTAISTSESGDFELLYAGSELNGQDDDYVQTENYSGLSLILTPSRMKRRFRRVLGVGVHQLWFTSWPNSPGPWIFEWGLDWSTSATVDGINREMPLLRFIWPGGHRRFSIFARQRLILFDETSIRWDPMDFSISGPFDNIHSAPRVELYDRSTGYRLVYRRTYRGSLLTFVDMEHHIPNARSTHSNMRGLLRARFSYTYGSKLNIETIQTQLFTQPSVIDMNKVPRFILNEETTIKRDPWSGQVLAIGEFNITQGPSAMYIVYAPKNLQLLRQLDHQGRLAQISLYPLSSNLDPLYNLSLAYRSTSFAPIQQREDQRGHVPRWVAFAHGPGGRMKAVERAEAGASLRSHCELVYNSEGRVARLRIEVSDPQLPLGNGRMEMESTSRSEELQFIYDSRGLLTRRGNWHYTFDEDGLLVERRFHNNQIVDRFQHNSKSLLIWAERTILSDSSTATSSSSWSRSSNAFDRTPVEDDIGVLRSFRVQYVYDAEGRLTVVRDTIQLRDMVQYFYADPSHPWRLTHVFNHGLIKTFRLHYESVKGHLFSVEEFDGVSLAGLDSTMDILPDVMSHTYGNPSFGRPGRVQVYMIITNHEGAPTAMFSVDGKPIWTAEYSALGTRRLLQPNRNSLSGISILEDQNVPLGYAGCLTDIHTRFLFCPPTGRAFDPLGSTFTAPDWQGLVSKRLPKVHWDPSILDTHKWSMLEQEYLNLGTVGLFTRLRKAIASPRSWLQQVGLDLDAVTPVIDLCSSFLGSKSNGLWNLPTLPIGFGLNGHHLDATGCKSTFLNTRFEQLSVGQSSYLTPGGPKGTGIPEFILHSDQLSEQHSVQLLPAYSMFSTNVTVELGTDGIIQLKPVINFKTLPSSRFSSHKKNFQSTELITILLDGTRLLDWWTEVTVEHRSTPMLIQSFARIDPGLSDTLGKLSQLGLELPVYEVSEGYNLTAFSRKASTELWITRRHIQWRIRSVFSWQKAIETAEFEAHQRGDQLAWKYETMKARKSSFNWFAANHKFINTSIDSATKHLLGFRYSWTYRELHHLLKFGRVDGYRWNPVITVSDNGTPTCRLYEHPGMYQVFPFDSTKPYRTFR